MRRLPLAATALATALLLVPVAPAAAKEVKLTRKASGTTVTVAKGDLLRVTLKENPSTGYGWRFSKRPAKTILGLRANHFKQGPQSPNGPSVGVPGTRIFKWRALQVGTTSLKIGNYPPGQGRKPASYFRLTVKVT
jgi:inhibitor of cysteine peptidase